MDFLSFVKKFDMIKNIDKKYKKFVKNFFVILFLINILLLPFYVFAIDASYDNPSYYDSDSSTQDGLAVAATIGELNTGETDISGIVGKIVNIVLSFVGTLFFILMLYAGFLWMTARGNEQQIQKAKDLIYAAVIGFVIIASAYAITDFLGSNVT